MIDEAEAGAAAPQGSTRLAFLLALAMFVPPAELPDLAQSPSTEHAALV
jgi:hypothetical protein